MNAAARLWTWADVAPYWAIGYTPFPIILRDRAGHTDKIPAVEGWTEPDEAWLAQVWSRPHAHVGLGLRGTLVALDADTPEDAEMLARALPGHPSQATPYRHGLHVLGRVGPMDTVGNKTKRTVRLPDGSSCKVDIRAVGGFVAHYGLDPIDPPRFPAWIVAQITKGDVKRDDDVPRTPAMALARVHDAVTALAAAQPGARNDTLCRWAYMCGRDVGAGLIERVPTRDALWQAGPYRWDGDQHADTLDRSLADGASTPSRRVPGDADLHVVAGKVQRDAASLQAILATVDAIAWDAWHGRLCLAHDAPWGDRAGDWGDATEANAAAWIAKAYELSYAPRDIHDHAVAVAQGRPHRNRLVEWLGEQVWDGTPRLSTIMDDYWDGVNGPDRAPRKWLISAVARAMNPGCKADCMLVLDGPQGIGKSRWLASLCPWPSLFSDSPLRLDDPRDLPVRLAPVWIYELAELSSINRREHAEVRALLSSARDDAVPKYGRNVVSRPRHTVFAGTSNPDSRLTRDPGGMRRYWVITVAARRQDITDHARGQIWAEAVAAWRSGEAHWLDADGEAEANAYAMAYASEDDTWVTAIAAWLKGREDATMADILGEALRIPLAAQSRRDQLRARAAMADLGWQAAKVYGGIVFSRKTT